MADKIFCGDGKAFGQYESVKISVCLDDLPEEFIKTAKNGKRYVSMVLNKKREPDQYGKTHYIEVDTWKPNVQSASQGSQAGYNQADDQQSADDPIDDDMPF